MPQSTRCNKIYCVHTLGLPVQAQPLSTVQVDVHPSKLLVLPSSQTSVEDFALSPQTVEVSQRLGVPEQR